MDRKYGLRAAAAALALISLASCGKYQHRHQQLGSSDAPVSEDGGGHIFSATGSTQDGSGGIDFTWDPKTILTIDRSFSITFRIYNNGRTAATDAYASSATCREVHVGALNPGQVLSGTTTCTNSKTTPGKFTLGIGAAASFPNGQVASAYESHDITVNDTPVDLNVTADNAAVSRQQTQDGSSFTIAVQVKNTGQAPFTSLRISGSSQFVDCPEISACNLGPGGDCTRNLSCHFTATPAPSQGSETVTISATANNTATRTARSLVTIVDSGSNPPPPPPPGLHTCNVNMPGTNRTVAPKDVATAQECDSIAFFAADGYCNDLRNGAPKFACPFSVSWTWNGQSGGNSSFGCAQVPGCF